MYNSVNHRIAPMGLLIFLEFCKKGLFGTRAYLMRGGLKKVFLAVGHIPVEIFLLANYLFNAAHTSNRVVVYCHVYKGEHPKNKLTAPRTL